MLIMSYYNTMLILSGNISACKPDLSMHNNSLEGLLGKMRPFSIFYKILYLIVLIYLISSTWLSLKEGNVKVELVFGINLKNS